MTATKHEMSSVRDNPFRCRHVWMQLHEYGITRDVCASCGVTRSPYWHEVFREIDAHNNTHPTTIGNMT